MSAASRSRLKSLRDGVVADRPAAEANLAGARSTGDQSKIDVATAALGKIDSDASSLQAQMETLAGEAADFETASRTEAAPRSSIRSSRACWSRSTAAS
ncbi:hypothetical protein [Chenggangzhangella methanolivorans]|uniref:hypothetical protein n=1 Tax=Chenggangzhangella methanolivorans TaxID=1437009 RepID=UPI0021BD6201|nr:hypothetical protein [Chenggangzhangella methanolivorans]